MAHRAVVATDAGKFHDDKQQDQDHDDDPVVTLIFVRFGLLALAKYNSPFSLKFKAVINNSGTSFSKRFPKSFERSSPLFVPIAIILTSVG